MLFNYYDASLWRNTDIVDMHARSAPKATSFCRTSTPLTPNSIRRSLWLFSQRKVRKCVQNVLVEHEQFPAGERAWRSGWVATGSKVNSKSLRNPKLRKNLHYHLAFENSLKLYVTADTSQRHLPTESLELRQRCEAKQLYRFCGSFGSRKLALLTVHI